ncbi:MAG: hypothetical protein EOO10_11235 [Chitinophagaceae bacterium]|nr:MAG: hypothetical protein EOO10_11235 [Chitinophagaceae bacterium]
MKKKFLSAATIGLALVTIISCSDNKAAEVNPIALTKKEPEKSKAPVKTDGPALGSIETGNYVLKLHRAFAYEPKGSEILAGMKPKPGQKFIYLDVSLRNTGTEKLEGGFLFIALKLTDENGTEYKKPAAALAAYSTDHPEDNNSTEYAALWETFEPAEFHREIIYAVEVPAEKKNFVLHLPVDRLRKEWKKISFSL